MRLGETHLWKTQRDAVRSITNTYSLGGMQYWKDTGLEGCRTGGMQGRRDAGKEGCRIGGMQERREAYKRDAGRVAAKFSILCFAKFPSNVAKFCETRNQNSGKNFAISRNTK